MSDTVDHPRRMRRQLVVVVDLDRSAWGDTIEEVADGLVAEYIHPGAAVTDAVMDPRGEHYLCQVVESEMGIDPWAQAQALGVSLRLATIWSHLP